MPRARDRSILSLPRARAWDLLSLSHVYEQRCTPTSCASYKPPHALEPRPFRLLSKRRVSAERSIFAKGESLHELANVSWHSIRVGTYPMVDIVRHMGLSSTNVISTSIPVDRNSNNMSIYFSNFHKTSVANAIFRD